MFFHFRYIPFINGSLRILNIDSSDAGYYTCKGASVVPDDYPDQEYAVQLQLACKFS